MTPTFKQEILRHAKRGSEEAPGYDYVYLVNMSNHCFNRAGFYDFFCEDFLVDFNCNLFKDVMGLRSQESRDFFLMATWLIMAAAEVDHGPFRKYTFFSQRKSFKLGKKNWMKLSSVIEDFFLLLFFLLWMKKYSF